MTFNVGDIIKHRSLGLMILTERCSESEQKGVGHRLHGNKLFRMQKLIARPELEDNGWILYESSVKRSEVRIADDNDIVASLTAYALDDDISADIGIDFFPAERTISLYSKDLNDHIVFNEQEIKTLIKKLSELNL